MPGTHSERSGVGQRISAAKKGKPAVTRDPDVATLQQSVTETRFERVWKSTRRAPRNWRSLA
jgi:hypothetical protein